MKAAAGTIILGSNILIVLALPSFTGREESIDPSLVSRLYDRIEKHLTPPWSNSLNFLQMISAIQDAASEGLDPYHYHLAEIENLSEKLITAENPDSGEAGRLEFLLSDSFRLLYSHLSSGKTDPAYVDPNWKIPGRGRTDDGQGFADSILTGGNIIETLHKQAPRNHEYINLKKALAVYQRLKEKGGWGVFRTNLHKLEPGIRHPDVALLRKRLSVTQGEIEFDPEDENLFDYNLYDQVVIFQHRHGLDPDGIVGKSTIEALNVPVDERIKTLQANLERWRWLNIDSGDTCIKVNIADFRLSVMVNNSRVFSTRAIVGQQERQTPVFSAILKYVTINPAWVVPPSILSEDVLPAIKKDSSYLMRHKMKVLRIDGTEVDPLKINWDNTQAEDFPYLIRQEPGIGNPLGTIKFTFPNKYNIYIHDTPYHSLFLRNTRTFSSGCIRIDDASELASFLLKNDPEWNLERIKQTIDEGEPKTILLKKPVPVYILYLTAWADEDGVAYFGRDIYNRDAQLISAIEQSPQ